ncbi:unnamed protein product [Blepharisma stoltei]|uniref:Maturase K n=1 Tax=Blepharisma stoltei TaxID=1481888 RepID=A0AAU9JG24_9CILI|nr:unnamed protein product [Blepharisma stoltei]
MSLLLISLKYLLGKSDEKFVRKRLKRIISASVTRANVIRRNGWYQSCRSNFSDLRIPHEVYSWKAAQFLRLVDRLSDFFESFSSCKNLRYGMNMK